MRIYIDVDCLVYSDINKYWDYFPWEDITCFGKALPVSLHDGWFEIDDVGEYRKCINFIPQMHGGIIFDYSGALWFFRIFTFFCSIRFGECLLMLTFQYFKITNCGYLRKNLCWPDWWLCQTRIINQYFL